MAIGNATPGMARGAELRATDLAQLASGAQLAADLEPRNSDARAGDLRLRRTPRRRESPCDGQAPKPLRDGRPSARGGQRHGSACDFTPHRAAAFWWSSARAVSGGGRRAPLKPARTPRMDAPCRGRWRRAVRPPRKRARRRRRSPFSPRAFAARAAQFHARSAGLDAAAAGAGGRRSRLTTLSILSGRRIRLTCALMTNEKRGKPSPLEARAEHARLGAEIAEHDRRYYQEDAPTISDADYDALRRRYAALEAEFPELAGADSLEQRRSARRRPRSFAKVRHAVPMLSLDNVFADDEVVEFCRPGPALPGPARRRAARHHRRAEDRRPLLLPALRGRRARPGGDARRRLRGRGRHRQCADDRRHSRSGCSGAPRDLRGARRGLS